MGNNVNNSGIFFGQLFLLLQLRLLICMDIEALLIWFFLDDHFIPNR